jgi:alkylation response protein AidB-like acyl-CoA dehydrogenase
MSGPMSDISLSRDAEVLVEEVSSIAAEVDCNSDHDSRIAIRKLASRGLLDLGLPGSGGTYSDQIRVLSDLASVCMTTAFTAWSHRMTVEYLVSHGGDDVRTDDVRNARRVGSTALAGTFRAAVGVAEVPVEARLSGSRRTANGFLSWASNLHDDAVVVTGVQDANSGDRSLIAFDIRNEGVEVLPVAGLLALDGSKSGALRLSDVELDERSTLACRFDDFIADIRPKFLLFQTAFVLGLVQGSLGAIGELRGPARSLEGEVDDARLRLIDLRSHLEDGGVTLDSGGRPDLRSCLQLRLDASHLATRSSQLELSVRGGSGYVAGSATARRVREALFLPVQSPTEAQLRWELEASS